MESDTIITDIQEVLFTIIPIIIPAIQVVGISQATILIRTITMAKACITPTTVRTIGIIRYEEGRIYCDVFAISTRAAGSGKKRLLLSSWRSHE
jgi:hypothetical protein